MRMSGVVADDHFDRPVLIPAPDYDSHPGYGAMLEPTDLDREQALQTLWPKLSGLLDQYGKSYPEEPAPIRNQAGDVLADLVRDGIVGLRLEEALKNLMLRVTEPHVAMLRAKRAARDRRRRTVGSSSVVIATRDESPEILELFTAALHRSGVLELAEAYKGRRLTPKFVTLQINDETDLGLDAACRIENFPLSPLHYMHVDTTIYGMKVIIYRSEVARENGPFRYIMGSNRVAETPFDFCLRKACDKAGLDSIGTRGRSLFYALPPELRKKANFGNDVLTGDPAVETLLSKEQLFTSEIGDMVLFDNCGMHRGAIFESGERQIFQILLTE
jgi:hypothetical protein